MAVVLTAAPAAAQQYPPAVNSLTVSCRTPAPGESIGVEARTFAAGADVTITLASGPVVIGTAAADASGAVSFQVTIPADTPRGSNTINATGQAPDGSTVSLSAHIAVANGCGGAAADVDSDTPAGSLPRTGDDSSIPLAKIGLGLAAVGGVITAIAAKRRKSAVAAA
jgi:LPXTG-motif cell wall-anchored protein